MKRLKSVTYVEAKAIAKGFFLWGFLRNTALYLASSAITAIVPVVAVWLLMGYSVATGFAVGGGTAVGLGGLWMVCSLGWLLAPNLSGVNRMMRGWMTSLILAAIGTLPMFFFHNPASVALLMGFLLATGFGFAPLLARASKAVDLSRFTSQDLPIAFLPPMQELPDNLPHSVQTILEQAFRDWTHLRDLSAFTAESPAGSYVDMRALMRDADRTVTYLMHRSAVVGKLVELAHERRDEHASRAADKAVSRMRSVGNVLHEAVNAASQFAATEDRDERRELSIRVDGLKDLAECLDLDVESFDAAVEEVRYRVSPAGATIAAGPAIPLPAPPVRTEIPMHDLESEVEAAVAAHPAEMRR
ncbi:MAG: hypothetical protein FWD57_11290 [Polyangiaceae bacterium]|nr:hypothetical protein [Polyangiaceae bacterium]